MLHLYLLEFIFKLYQHPGVLSTDGFINRARKRQKNRLPQPPVFCSFYSCQTSRFFHRISSFSETPRVYPMFASLTAITRYTRPAGSYCQRSSITVTPPSASRRQSPSSSSPSAMTYSNEPSRRSSLKRPSFSERRVQMCIRDRSRTPERTQLRSRSRRLPSAV